MITITPPSHAGSREQARALVSSFPPDLTGSPVALECSGLTISSPSFLDELIKQVLVLRNAESLDVLAAPGRTGTLLERAAQNRNVAARLHVALRTG
jgi:hypothetical protein